MNLTVICGVHIRTFSSSTNEKCELFHIDLLNVSHNFCPVLFTRALVPDYYIISQLENP